MRVDGEQPDGFLVPDLLPPGTSPRHEEALAALIRSTEISPAGLATIDQAVPFQCSMTALLATLALVSCTLLKPLPTAQALSAEIAVTSLSPVGSAVFAVFTIDQAVPL